MTRRLVVALGRALFQGAQYLGAFATGAVLPHWTQLSHQPDDREQDR